MAANSVMMQEMQMDADTIPPQTQLQSNVGADSSSVDQNSEALQNLTKKQFKKLMKKKKWLAKLSEKKKKEKEKIKLKKQALAAAGITLPPRILTTMASSMCKQCIAIDLSFDDLMSEKDLTKCLKQIHRCYSKNRRIPDPAQFYLTSFTGKCAKAMEKNVGFRNWDINFSTDSYEKVFASKEIVYLTSESSNVIEHLDESKVYIIGGLVDHNSHKGLCLNRAVENGISHARLPIEEYLEMKTSRVLTINHVFQILLEVTRGKSWKDAFLSTIPARKGATSKEEILNSDDDK